MRPHEARRTMFDWHLASNRFKRLSMRRSCAICRLSPFAAAPAFWHVAMSMQEPLATSARIGSASVIACSRSFMFKAGRVTPCRLCNSNRYTVDSKPSTMVRHRAYEELARRIGSVDDIISEIIKTNGHATILEIGAGFGIPMHQIHLMFGDNVTMIGLNRKPHHGSHDLSMRVGLEHGIFDNNTIEFYKINKPPMYMCADAGEGIPIESDSVDFVYSQASIPFVRDKANLIHEVNRILNPGGCAHLQMNLSPKFMLGETGSLFRIHRDGQVQSIEDFVDEIDGLAAKTSLSGVGCIRVEKRSQIPLGLSAVSFERVGDPNCPYIESTYQLSN